jgi:hypothetical protein
MAGGEWSRLTMTSAHTYRVEINHRRNPNSRRNPILTSNEASMRNGGERLALHQLCRINDTNQSSPDSESWVASTARNSVMARELSPSREIATLVALYQLISSLQSSATAKQRVIVSPAIRCRRCVVDRRVEVTSGNTIRNTNLVTVEPLDKGLNANQ